MAALEIAVQAAIAASGVSGQDIAALAIDTTGSSVIPVDQNLRPLDEYYLWCDHRAGSEAAEITRPRHTRRSWQPSIGVAASTPASGAFAKAAALAAAQSWQARTHS